MSMYMRPNYGEWAVTIFILFIAACAISPIVGSALTATLQPSYRIPILSVNDESLIHGVFTLGSGTIDEKPVYVSYAALSNGGYKMITFPADRSTIFENEGILPYVQVYSCHSDFPFSRSDCPWIANEYDIHVPKGTIKQPMYALDGKL